MNKSRVKISKKEKASTQLNILQNARFATILFMFGCFLNFIEFNYSEKAILQSMSNIDEKLIQDNKVKAALIAKYVSIIFLIAIIIFTCNAFTTLELGLSDTPLDRDAMSSKSNKSARTIAFFDLIKVLGYGGAAIGYFLALENLENP